jgi:hypothetical protein
LIALLASHILLVTIRPSCPCRERYICQNSGWIPTKCWIIVHIKLSYFISFTSVHNSSFHFNSSAEYSLNEFWFKRL